jgi:hypothetical protein
MDNEIIYITVHLWDCEILHNINIDWKRDIDLHIRRFAVAITLSSLSFVSSGGNIYVRH